ncbi:MAG: hypothetical protein LBR11_03790 [Deltaproteobacteria bacterium]|jgi:hypothetical protein|nr:hypothetical protein [Deltaproteobacteria bacterium]
MTTRTTMLGELKNQIHPLSLSPIMAEKPWGPRQPSKFYPADAQAAWGEIFLAIRDFGLTSRVASGPLADQPIHKIAQNWGRELIEPPGSAGWPIPLTVWLERTGDQPGPVRVKSGPEFWRILEATPESWIGAGEDPNQSDWPQRLQLSLAEPGDNLIFPAGLPQAQGPGLTVIKAGLSGISLETLYDWGRRPDIWDYQNAPGVQVRRSNEPLLALGPDQGTEGLTTLGQMAGLEISLLRSTFQTLKGGRFAIICPISGQGRLNSSGVFPTNRLRLGGATLVPSGLGPYSIVSNSSLTALIFTQAR